MTYEPCMCGGCGRCRPDQYCRRCHAYPEECECEEHDEAKQEAQEEIDVRRWLKGMEDM